MTLIKVLGFQRGDLGSWFLGRVGMNIHTGDAPVPERLGCWGRVVAGTRCVCEAGSAARRERGPGSPAVFHPGHFSCSLG